MKFHWFHLMPYPYLPDDFKQKYHSVWVDPPAGELFDPVKGHQVYNDYLDQLEYAERCGYDGICVNEHHQNGYGLMPSPNLMAAALARRTSKAKLVVLGNSVALYDPPTRVAEEMAMLDVMSGGRLVAGFPVGTPMDTVYCYGANPATLRDRADPALRHRRLLRLDRGQLKDPSLRGSRSWSDGPGVAAWSPRPTTWPGSTACIRRCPSHRPAVVARVVFLPVAVTSTTARCRPADPEVLLRLYAAGGAALA